MLTGSFVTPFSKHSPPASFILRARPGFSTVGTSVGLPYEIASHDAGASFAETSRRHDNSGSLSGVQSASLNCLAARTKATESARSRRDTSAPSCRCRRTPGGRWSGMSSLPWSSPAPKSPRSGRWTTTSAVRRCAGSGSELSRQCCYTPPTAYLWCLFLFLPCPREFGSWPRLDEGPPGRCELSKPGWCSCACKASHACFSICCCLSSSVNMLSLVVSTRFFWTFSCARMLCS